MNRYAPLEKKIGIRFKDINLLDAAFVHTSYLNEHRDEKKEDNERLEFLGDAVLELVVTEHLYRHFPEASEGDMTMFRSALVKGKHLAKVADDLSLGEFLYLSRGEEKSGGRKKAYILANTVEALIGAVYLDKSFSKARSFISRFILKYLNEIIERGVHIDNKSNFQELSQEKLDTTPTYSVVAEEGPDHRKIFTVAVHLGKTEVARGKGSNKQAAEEEAALAALKKKGWL